MGFLDRFTKPDATVQLTIPKITVELGYNLKGAVAISSEEEFDSTSVRCELRCVEKKRRERWIYDEERKRKVRRVNWDVATLHSADPKAAGPMHLIPGFSKTFPFKVNIPAGGREPFDGVDGNVSWFIKGVLTIKGRPDVTSKPVEIQIIKATTPVTEKEEVEMVPCEYCETLMPNTVSSCPNCGAPRKA